MSDMTPSDGTESQNDSDIINAVSNDADAGYQATEQKKEAEASLTDSELLQEFENKENEAPAKAQSDILRESAKERFLLAEKGAINKVKKSLDDGEDIEKALSSIKDKTLQDRVRKIYQGDVAVSEPAQSESNNDDPREIFRQMEDEKEAKSLLPKICKDGGIDGNSAYAIGKRRELKFEIDSIVSNQKSPNRAEAIRLAALKLGITENSKIDEARMEGARLKSIAHQPSGLPNYIPSKPTKITKENLNSLSDDEFLMLSDKMAREGN